MQTAPTSGAATRATVSALLAEAVGREERVHACVLTSREVVHARVVRVVHEVPDRVDAGLVAARIATDRATERRRLLRGRVADEVAVAVTATLERVIEAHPVAGLVGAGVAEVVRRRRATG